MVQKSPSSQPAVGSNDCCAGHWQWLRWVVALVLAVVVLTIVRYAFSPYQATLLLLFLIVVAMAGFGAQAWMTRIDNLPYLPKAGDKLQNKDAVVILGKSVLVALAAVYVALAAAHACFPKTYSATGLVGTWALAGLSLGGTMGFLFGHPRIESNGDKGEKGEPKSGLKAQSSTSLDQINDWLTKAIVGVGLVEAKKILAYGHSLATEVGKGLSGSSGTNADPLGYALASAILITFPLVGFVTSYLVTRTFVALALGRAEVALSGTVGAAAEIYVRNTLAPEDPHDPLAKNGANKAGEQAPAEIAQLGQLDLSQVSDPTQVLAWAKFKMSQGLDADAERGFTKAFNMPGTDNAEVALQAARSQEPEASNGLQWALTAYRNINASTDPTLKEQIYNSLMFRLLYAGGDRNIADVIRYGEEYVADPTNKTSGAILVNLACAYGQKAGKLDKAGEEFKKARARALDCVQKALAESSGWKPRLALLYHPDAPEKIKDPSLKEENDLEVFHPDPDFERLLG